MHKKIKIFDLGSNTFRKTRDLIERFSNQGEVTQVHTFEAQKELALKNLESLKIDYPSIIFIHNNVAAWNEDTILDFYEAENTRGRNYKAGSSLVKHNGGRKDLPLKYEGATSVQAINFINYFKINADKSTYNFIKMDIEGAEYFILPELIQSNCINYLNELSCEFHARMYHEDLALRKKFISLGRKIIQDLKYKNIKFSKWY